MSIMMQGPGAARPATAEEAQLDQRIELAAKKAALRSLETQESGPGTGVPAPPGMGARVIIEQDGKTTVLENPTPEQLVQFGVGTTAPPLPVNSKQIVAMSVVALSAVVGIVWLVLHYFRGGRSAAAPRESAEMQARMARIENAIESVAVEVERISEGQRFTSRILSDGAAVPFAVPARGEAEPHHNGEA